MIWNGSLPFPNYKKVKLFCRVYVKHYTDMRMVYASVNVWLDPPGHRSTFVRLFVHHYFTLPLGPVSLAFTQFHKSFDLLTFFIHTKDKFVRLTSVMGRTSNKRRSLVAYIRSSGIRHGSNDEQATIVGS